ncbi:MAG: DNA-binding response regulator [Sphingobacteriia bacterium]|nr:MAG: DNA-binding response regulator [Sphingobacteriia bacterium]TAG29928.1 MAG: DNA-binding response regulator [Sphingobacteriia bacterium]
MVSVMVCDDCASLLDFVVRAIAEFSDFKVVGKAASGEECIELIEKGNIPDVLLLDVSMPKGMSGYEVAMHLKQKLPIIKIIAFSALTDDLATIAMIRFGTKAFVVKGHVVADELAEIIRLVMADGEYYPPKFRYNKSKIDEIKKTPIPWLEKIKPEEMEVIKLIANDCPQKQVPDQLKISSSLMGKRLNKLFKKTNTHNAIGLINFLRKVGLLK